MPLIESTEGHLRAYDLVDIALDTFPYNGTTTTFEALWMGVPVVCFEGDRHASRVGASILKHTGLDESLLASDAQDYVTKAINLAQDKRQLTEFSSTLRTTLQASHLCNAQSFAEDFEKMLRHICSTHT